MAISKGLLLKVIGGLAGTLGVTGGGIVLGNHVRNKKGDLDQDSEKNTVGNDKEVADPTQASTKSPAIEDAGSQPQQNRDINSSKQPSEEDGSLNPSGGNPATGEEIRSPSAPTSGAGQDTVTTPGSGEGSEQPSEGKSATDPAPEPQQKGDVNPSGGIGGDLGGAGGQPGVGSQSGDRGETQDTQREEQNSLPNDVNNTLGSDGLGNSGTGSGSPSEKVTTKENSDSHSTDSSDHSEQPPRVSEPQPGQGDVGNPPGQPGAGTPSGTTTVTTTEGQKTESVDGEGGSSQQKENVPTADLSDQKVSEEGNPPAGDSQVKNTVTEGVDTPSGLGSGLSTGEDSPGSSKGLGGGTPSQPQGGSVDTGEGSGSSNLSDQVPVSSGSQSGQDGVNNPEGQAGSGGNNLGQQPSQTQESSGSLPGADGGGDGLSVNPPLTNQPTSDTTDTNGIGNTQEGGEKQPVTDDHTPQTTDRSNDSSQAKSQGADSETSELSSHSNEQQPANNLSEQPQISGESDPTTTPVVQSSDSSCKLSGSASTLDASKIQEMNGKLKELGLPEECKFPEDKSKTIIELQLTEEMMKKMKFSDGNGETEIETFEEGFKLKIELLEEDKKNDYGLENNLLFTFYDNKESITLNSSFSIFGNSNREFQMENEELTVLWGDDGKKITEKIKLKTESNGSNTYIFEENTTSLKYSSDENNNIKELTFNLPFSQKITVLGEQDGWNQGIKVTIEKAAKGNENTLENGDYEIMYKDKEGDKPGFWYLSKKTNSTT